MANYKLMIPGPVDVEDEVLSKMTSPVPAHYGDAWMKVYLETIDCLKRVFQTENDLFIGGGQAAPPWMHPLAALSHYNGQQQRLGPLGQPQAAPG